jgi:hypothetical protein
MRAYAFLAMLGLSIFVACASSSPTPPPSVVAPTASAQKLQVVQLTALAASTTHPNAQAVVTLQFAPMHLEIGKTSDGECSMHPADKDSKENAAQSSGVSVSCAKPIA